MLQNLFLKFCLMTFLATLSGHLNLQASSQSQTDSSCRGVVRAVLASGGEEGISGQRSLDSQKLWAQRLNELYGSGKRILVISFAVDFYGRQEVDAYLADLKRFGLFEGRELVLLSDAADEQAMLQMIESADGFFTLGGNTFKLVHDLHSYGVQSNDGKMSLLSQLQKQVALGVPYAGVSAGSNIAAPTMMTTNDMPIVHPPSFETLGIVPFQINPHFVSGKAHHYGSDGQLHPYGGETREVRIKEFHLLNSTPVLGVPELSLLVVNGERITFEAADPTARAHLFLPNREVQLLKPGTNLSHLR